MVFCWRNQNIFMGGGGLVWHLWGQASISFLSFQWKERGRALISCGSLWLNSWMLYPTGTPGGTYLTSTLDLSEKRSEKVLPQVYSFNKESYPWGGEGERWSWSWLTSSFLLPSYLAWLGFIFIHSAEMLPSALNWPLSSTHTLRTKFVSVLNPSACKCSWYVRASYITTATSG